MTGSSPSSAEQAEFAEHDASDLKGDESRSRDVGEILHTIESRRRWELTQRKFSFWTVTVFAFGSMIFLFIFLGHVLSSDDTGMGEWGVVALTAGVIGQSAFLMHSTIPGSGKS